MSGTEFELQAYHVEYEAGFIRQNVLNGRNSGRGFISHYVCYRTDSRVFCEYDFNIVYVIQDLSRSMVSG